MKRKNWKEDLTRHWIKREWNQHSQINDFRLIFLFSYQTHKWKLNAKVARAENYIRKIYKTKQIFSSNFCVYFAYIMNPTKSFEFLFGVGETTLGVFWAKHDPRGSTQELQMKPCFVLYHGWCNVLQDTLLFDNENWDKYWNLENSVIKGGFVLVLLTCCKSRPDVFPPQNRRKDEKLEAANWRTLAEYHKRCSS